MIYVIVFLIVFIICVSAFIAFTFREVFNLDYKLKILQTRTMPIIERTYKAVDLHRRINYIYDQESYGRMYPYSRYTARIFSDEQKQAIIKKACYALTEEMLSNGLIEITDSKNDYNLINSPYDNYIDLKVKVYKPL